MLNKILIKKLVKEQVLKILNYLEYIYICNIEDEEKIKQLKDLIAKTNLENMYKAPNVHYTTKNYSYVILESSDIYICLRDLKNENLKDKIISLCITQTLKDAIKYTNGDILSKKCFNFYYLLSDLNVIDDRYLSIFYETDLIASHLSNKVINY